MDNGLIFAFACALVALAYGAWQTKWILSQPDGNDRMREIAAAIQEGAGAYLNRQYTTIGIAGAVLFALIGIFLNWPTAIGFAIFVPDPGYVERLDVTVTEGRRARSAAARFLRSTRSFEGFRARSGRYALADPLCRSAARADHAWRTSPRPNRPT